MARQDANRWDEKWALRDEPVRPHELLLLHRQWMSGGIALDIACGLGQNTRWLAQIGYQALGLDISFVALKKARSLAKQDDLSRQTLFVQFDLDQWSIPAKSIELICVIRYLDRALFPAIKRALRPGGLPFYETRHMGILSHQPSANTEYLLQRGELLEEFADWHVLYHHEGQENASIVARRPDQPVSRETLVPRRGSKD